MSEEMKEGRTQSAGGAKAEAPFRRAAFINAIADEGTKAEAIQWLQKTWNEYMELRDEYEKLRPSAPSSEGVAIDPNPRITLQEADERTHVAMKAVKEKCAQLCEREAEKASGDAYSIAAGHCAKVIRKLEIAQPQSSAAPAAGVASFDAWWRRAAQNMPVQETVARQIWDASRTFSATGGAIESPEDVDRRTMLNETAVGEAIDAEPELPGPMPDEMWEAIRNDRDACMEALRITVRQTKSGIKDRLGISRADSTPRRG